MMSEVLRHETAVFLLAVWQGVGLTFLYDLIRVLRRVFAHSLAVISLEDVLFWLLAGFLTFCFAYQNTDGVIRGYVAAGIGLGALLYHAAVSSLVVRALAGGLNFVKKMLLAALHLLLRPVTCSAAYVRQKMSKPLKKFCKIRKKRIEFARKRGYNSSTMRENRPKGVFWKKLQNKKG